MDADTKALWDMGVQAMREQAEAARSTMTADEIVKAMVRAYWDHKWAEWDDNVSADACMRKAIAEFVRLTGANDPAMLSDLSLCGCDKARTIIDTLLQIAESDS